MLGRVNTDRKRLRLARITCAVLIACVVPSGGYAAFLVTTNNFHTVIPNELYRSAQPSSAEITDYKIKYGIKTIINLRGANPQQRWYQNEIATSERDGITHIDFGMSARQMQPPEKIKRLIALFASAQKPILIHCMSGADRTGLASAVYLAAISKQGEEAAEGQLSVRYGHFSIPYLSQAYPMDKSFDSVEGIFGYVGTAWDALLRRFA